MIVKTKFSYDEEALVAFFTFHLKRKDRIKWVYYGIALIFFIAGIILSFCFDQMTLGILIFISSTIMILVYPLRAKNAAKKTANSRYKRPAQEIIFTDERIEQHLEKQILVYKWDLIHEVDETNNYMYFYISKNSALIVSKDCITNTEYNSLVELVKQKNLKYYKYSKD